MADTSTPKTNLNYYYIKPTLHIPNVVLILIIIAIFCYILIEWNYINVNWENEKCNNANFFLAPLFGKDSATTLQQCTTDIINKSVSDSVGKLDLSNKINDLSNNVANFKTSLESQKAGDVSKVFTAAADTITGIQDNVSKIKQALRQVLGSVVLNSYMYDGVIQSTKNLQNTDLVNMVNQYNAMQKNINQNAKDPTQQITGMMKV